MALYTIGDTHLSEMVPKPMDVFGGAWQDYRRKIIENFGRTLGENDCLVLCGDFSWGMRLEETIYDFRLLDRFPGRKIILKGNHDYWWTTVRKMEAFLLENGVHSVSFLHNNHFMYDGVAICGTKGCTDEPDDAQESSKLFNRELMRLEASLMSAVKAGADDIFCFLHYPPVFAGKEIAPLTGLLKRYGVSRCYYGHLHGAGLKNAFSGVRDGVSYRLVSADNVGFCPVLVRP